MAEPESARDLSPDDIFEVLSNARRRYMLHYLHEQGGSASLSDIADHIAAWEYDTPVDRIDNDQRRRVYISLYQTHLPKLIEYEIVQYDDSEKTVRLTDRVGAIDRFLYLEDSTPSRWWLLYVLLAVGAMVLLAGQQIEGSPLSALSPEVTALLIAGAFVLLSAVHYATRRLGRPRRRRGLD